MLNEDDLRPGDLLQDKDGDFWHVHEDGKLWCSEPDSRISFEYAKLCGPFTYAPGCDPKRDATSASGGDSVNDESKWTSDDLPSLIVNRTDGSWVLSAGLRHDLAEWLNAHHPKPVHPMGPELARLRRERDEARRALVAKEDEAVRECHAAYRERDAAVARADQLRNERDDAVQSCMVVGRERDEWKARAEKVEQLIPAYAMLDVWGALGRDSIHFDDWYDEHGYAEAWAELTAAVREGRSDLDAARENAEHYQAMFDATERQRDEWKARAEKAEADREDIAEEFADFRVEVVAEAVKYRESNPQASGDDPAVYVVRESDIAAVKVTEHAAGWSAESKHLVSGWGKGKHLSVDMDIDRYRAELLNALAVQRAIEAGQAVDPVEELAGQIEAATRTAIRQVCDDLATVAPSLDPLAVERAMEVTAASRKVAVHVLGQEADDE